MGIDLSIVQHGGPLEETFETARYVWRHAFFSKALEDCDYIDRCEARCFKAYGEGQHDYYCDRDTIYRPKDFTKLRADCAELIELHSTVGELIDYLERNPNAWLEYS
jgi:hypothetical protein